MKQKNLLVKFIAVVCVAVIVIGMWVLIVKIVEA